MTKRKDIKELYPDLDQHGYFYGPGDYQPLLDSFGDIAIQVSDSDYQGDTRVLYKRGRQYGVLIFGWGSCSGCDSLQACDSYDELDQLRDGLEKDIKWRTKRETLAWLKDTRAREGEYSWHAQETRDFYAQCIALLESKAT